jgi:bifunctional polynucleotide phosphatase/kinase
LIRDSVLQLFCSAAADGIFRKPRTGVWEYLMRHTNGGVAVDMEKSFYCGDAAGRKRSNGKKDFSCSGGRLG